MDTLYEPLPEEPMDNPPESSGNLFQFAGLLQSRFPRPDVVISMTEGTESEMPPLIVWDQYQKLWSPAELGSSGEKRKGTVSEPERLGFTAAAEFTRRESARNASAALE